MLDAHFGDWEGEKKGSKKKLDKSEREREKESFVNDTPSRFL
jgi:hypothetical protein